MGGAVFPNDTALVIWSDDGDNNYVLLQPSWGKVGIGTNTPLAKLDIAGSVIIGTNGTLINNIIKSTITKNLATVQANSATIETFTATGAALGSAVSISPANALADGLLIAYARVSAINTIEVKFMNVTNAAINPSTMNFYFSVVE